ncbi:MAG: PqqD family protein [Chloroflexota bacterium]|nr:PqqD family protein [Chloroflexota bacterium]MBI5703642.1 PqqD family protein [Chloroflexota bacterium]
MRDAIVPVAVDGFQIEMMDGEMVLLHPSRNIIIHGNQTSALIWQLCDGKRTVDEIVELLSAAYADAANDIRNDVPAAIQTLMDQGALTTR